jgi:hypothetical protein
MTVIMVTEKDLRCRVSTMLSGCCMAHSYARSGVRTRLAFGANGFAHSAAQQIQFFSGPDKQRDTAGVDVARQELLAR